MGPRDRDNPRVDAASQPAVPDARAEDDLLVAAARAHPREFSAPYRCCIGPVYLPDDQVALMGRGQTAPLVIMAGCDLVTGG